MILYAVRREKALRLSRDSRGWVCSQGSCQAPSARVPRELQSRRHTTAYRESVSPTGSPTDMLRLSHAKTQTTSKYITIGSALWHQRYMSQQGFGNSQTSEALNASFYECICPMFGDLVRDGETHTSNNCRYYTILCYIMLYDARLCQIMVNYCIYDAILCYLQLIN